MCIPQKGIEGSNPSLSAYLYSIFMNNPTTAAPTDFVSLLNNVHNVIFNMTSEAAEEAVVSGDAERVRQIEGQFAIVKKVGQQVFLARSIGRPMRYFLAKQVSGPLLIVAERIDEIYNFLKGNEASPPVPSILYPYGACTLRGAPGSNRLPRSQTRFIPDFLSRKETA